MAKDFFPDVLVPALRKHISAPAPAVLFHYTDQSSFVSIVGQRELWLSDPVYLNDAMELHYGLELLKATWGSFDDAARSSREGQFASVFLDDVPRLATNALVFVASMSEAGDDLSQWRAYCRETGGLSLGLGTARLRELVQSGCILVPVIYDPIAQESFAHEVISGLLDLFRTEPTDGSSQALQAFVSHLVAAVCLKTPAYAPEKEWRLVGLRVYRGRDPVQVRPGRSTLIPYFRLPLPRDDKETEPLFPEVYCGPTPQAALAAQAVLQYFSSLGLQKPKVAATAIPFRNW